MDQPKAVRMSGKELTEGYLLDSLADVQQSLERIASSEKVGPAFTLLHRLHGFIDRGVADQQQTFAQVRKYTDQVCFPVETQGNKPSGRSSG
jgi:hypothetical protein